ncbi:MAG: CHAT domain-containing protein [Chitinophagaceae bacterium]|nr:CHAT domain-containing protein [Chitinophagaceae bacterium]
MKIIVLLCSLLLLSFFVSAQTWKELNTEFKRLTNNSNLGIEYETAFKIAEKSVEAAKKEFGESDSNYATSLSNLAFAYSFYNNFEKSKPLYIQAQEIRKRILGEMHPDYASGIQSMGDFYYRKDEKEKAEAFFIQAINLRKKILGENHPDYAESLTSLGQLYTDMSLYTKGNTLFIEAREINKKILTESDPGYVENLNSLALLYTKSVQYEKAEPIYIIAKDATRKLFGEAGTRYAKSLSTLSELYGAMFQFDKQEKMLVQAIDIYKQVHSETHPNYAGMLYNLAGIYSRKKEYEKAELLFVKAMEIFKAAQGKSTGYTACLNGLGILFMVKEDYKKAESYFLESRELKIKLFGKQNSEYAISLNNLAEVYTATGQYQKAEPLYFEAIPIIKKNRGENSPSYTALISNLAVLYSNTNQVAKAVPLFIEQSNTLIKNLLKNFTVLSEREKGNYLDINASLISLSNSFAYKLKKVPAAILMNNLNQQLVFKSLSLSDTKNILLSIQQNPDTLLNQLLKKWQADKSILTEQYSLPVTSRRTDIHEMEINIEGLEKELNRKSAEFRNQQKSIRISLQDVRKNLEPNEVAIEFVNFKFYNKKWTNSTIYAAYILNKNDSVPVFVPLFEEKQLQQLLDSAGNTATSMVSSFYRGLETKNKSAVTLGKELYKLVWQPLEAYFKWVKKISFSLAGKLHSIAFHALQIDSTMILMDKYYLQQYTSTRQVVLRENEKKNPQPQSVILFGDPSFTMDSLQLVKQKEYRAVKEKSFTPIYDSKKRSRDNNSWNNLSGTAEEVSKIKQLFDQNNISTKSYTQSAASEENLKALSGNSPQILHIATHGFFLPEPDKKRKENNFNNENTYTLADDPLLRSGLILSGGNYAWSGKTPIEGVEDGIATAYEIAQLNLSNTELVVLSACETALGDVKGSEGVFGLQRAFKMAGVKKMIVSLWQVPDKETAELMTTFYGYWMKGKSINESFTQAQADMRKKYSPFYWAAFVLVE